MTMSDKILLRKGSVIETVNDELKNICQGGTLKAQILYQFHYKSDSWTHSLFILPEKTSYKISNIRSQSIDL